MVQATAQRTDLARICSADLVAVGAEDAVDQVGRKAAVREEAGLTVPIVARRRRRIAETFTPRTPCAFDPEIGRFGEQLVCERVFNTTFAQLGTNSQWTLPTFRAHTNEAVGEA